MGIAGLGVVGGALYKCLSDKGVNTRGYDKYKVEHNNFTVLLTCDVIFMCLPTPYDFEIAEYDKRAIYDVCNQLEENGYAGLIVIKSTVEPETTNDLCVTFPTLKFVHNPEFLTARTALEDCIHQKHIVLGRSTSCPDDDFEMIVELMHTWFPDAEVSRATSTETEMMKIGVNSFYAVKVQFFNELYLTCEKNGCNYDVVRSMMLKNGWIHPMHTAVPGPDGQLSYGGMCFPKDTCALLSYMQSLGTPCEVLGATICERNSMRSGN